MSAYADPTFVPVPDAGSLYPRTFDCGSGLTPDDDGPTAENSYMRLVQKLSPEDFNRFCETLSADGFSADFCRETPAGLFRRFSRGNICIYTYYIFCERTVRVIRENSGSPAPGDFGFAGGGDLFPDTAMMQFGLYYSDMVNGVTCDCGMNYAFRLQSGELVLIDGGEMEQATDLATDEYMRRLEALTGGQQKFTVAAWFCTHPHDDHMDFFLRLLDRFPERFEVKRVMFNFHAAAYMPHSGFSARSVARLRQLLARQYPEVVFLKLHTGQQVTLGSLTAEVLTCHEDIFGLHPEREHIYEGINETSTIMRFTAAGKSVVLLGDCHISNGNLLTSRYAAAGLHCDYMQAAHHCINDAGNVYAFARPEAMLVPEGRYLILKNDRVARNFRLIAEFCPWERIFVAGDATTVWHFYPDRCHTEYFPVQGCPYDGSNRF